MTNTFFLQRDQHFDSFFLHCSGATLLHLLRLGVCVCLIVPIILSDPSLFYVSKYWVTQLLWFTPVVFHQLPQTFSHMRRIRIKSNFFTPNLHWIFLTIYSWIGFPGVTIPNPGKEKPDTSFHHTFRSIHEPSTQYPLLHPWHQFIKQ